MISALILKFLGWHDFRYCQLTHRWYGFPPHLNYYISQDVAVPGLMDIVRGLT